MAKKRQAATERLQPANAEATEEESDAGQSLFLTSPEDR